MKGDLQPRVRRDREGRLALCGSRPPVSRSAMKMHRCRDLDIPVPDHFEHDGVRRARNSHLAVIPRSTSGQFRGTQGLHDCSFDFRSKPGSEVGVDLIVVARGRGSFFSGFGMNQRPTHARLCSRSRNSSIVNGITSPEDISWERLSRVSFHSGEMSGMSSSRPRMIIEASRPRSSTGSRAIAASISDTLLTAGQIILPGANRQSK